jgi:hypothetical protein
VIPATRLRVDLAIRVRHQQQTAIPRIGEIA